MKKRIYLGIFVVLAMSLVLWLGVFAEDTNNVPIREKKVADASTTEKKTIYDIMLNSVDYFSTVQGNAIMKLGVEDEVTVQYKVDMEAAYTSETVRGTETDIDVIANKDEAIIYNNSAKGFLKGIRTLEKDPIADMNTEERTQEEGGVNVWYYRDDPTGLVYAKESIFPQERIFGYLYDFAWWDILGEEIYAERDCWVINGQLEGEYAQKVGICKFTFKVDKKTGCLLAYEGYDASGNLKDYIITDNIIFDAPVVVTYCDEGEYEGYMDWTEAALKSWENVEQSN